MREGAVVKGKNNKNKVEFVVVALIGIILFFMSSYLLNENFYIESRDNITKGTIIDDEKEGHFIDVPVFIYKTSKGDFLFAKGEISGKFEVGESYDIIYREDKPKTVRVLYDFKSRFFDAITLMFGSVVAFYVSYRFYKNGII